MRHAEDKKRFQREIDTTNNLYYNTIMVKSLENNPQESIDKNELPFRDTLPSWCSAVAGMVFLAAANSKQIQAAVITDPDAARYYVQQIQNDAYLAIVNAAIGGLILYFQMKKFHRLQLH